MTESRQHLRGIARGGALGLIGAVVSAGTTFMLVLIVTNTMEKSEAGQFFSGTSLFMIAVALCTLGTDAGLGRFTAKYVVEGRPEAARKCWTNALAVTFVLALVVALVMLGARDRLADLVGMSSRDAGAMIALLAIGVPAATLMTVALSATRSLATMRPTVFVDKFFRTTTQSGLALAVLVGGGGLLALGYAWSIPYVLGAGIALFVLRRSARLHLFGHGDVHGVRREFWRFTWPRSVAQISQMTIQRADIIIIGALISPAAAAVYTAATRFIAFGQFGSQAIQQTVQPRFSQLIASGKLDVLADVYRTSTAWSMLISWPVYLAIGCAPGIYLSLFGSGYRQEGQVVVVVMAVAMMVGVASGPVDTMLLMSGRSSLSLTNSLVALTLNLSLCFVLIPRVGILGAAIAWNAAVVVRCALGYVQVRGATGLSPFSRAAAIAAGAPLLCFGVPVGLLSWTGTLTAPLYGIAVVLLTCVYCAVLWTQRAALELTALRALLERRGSPTSPKVAT